MRVATASYKSLKLQSERISSQETAVILLGCVLCDTLRHRKRQFWSHLTRFDAPQQTKKRIVNQQLSFCSHFGTARA